MLIVRRQDQTGNETEKGIEIVIEKGTGKLLKRGLQAETSVSLETGGRDIPLRPMKGTGTDMVAVSGITGTTRRVAAIIAKCLGVTLMDHLIMVEVTVVTSQTMTGSKIMIVIEIMNLNRIRETVGIHV